VAQPTLFALVASSVSVSQLKGDTVVKGLIILAFGLTVRCTVAFLAVSGPRLQTKERLFTALAWIPKATVQAALGAVALEEARSEVHLDMGHDVLAICLLAILVAAPIGAAIVAITGPRLLTSQDAEQGLSVSKSCEASASNLISVA
jgi:NhaP-type Na+/H+ or K+/H+ antiporter